MKARIFALLFIVLTGVLSMKAYATIGQEPYTGFDDVLIPEPALPYDPNKGQSQPWEIYRELFQFDPVVTAIVKTPDNWGLELGTNVYITHAPVDRHTTPKHRAESWIKKITSTPMTNYKLIEQGAVKLPGVSAIATDQTIEPYRFTVESNGRGVIDFEGTKNYYDNERYVQRFYILPISRDEVVTVRAVRNKIDDVPNTQFSTQWEHFLKTLKREVANTRSTTQGSDSRTRRYYTHAFSFEIYMPDEHKGNQWRNEFGAVQSVTWKTPQGEINFTIKVNTHRDLTDAAAVNATYKKDQKDIAENTASMAAELKLEAPKMTYLEKPIGTATAYGHREDEVSGDYASTSMEFETVYKSGKEIQISLSGSKAAIDANEKIIYDWLARFKFLP